ncbi:hypothetical protein [Methanoculleus receptaculi]|uniref:Uncharacterized protein n=1 Tax=Methanoculleus receptaculi TaxID=394967 RepID=A0AAX4FWE4_9EURY|nr:hypothetical protein [Methanoculleus receptaculi]WOX58022.1 hypothetical protein R6Y96_01845 [Methanoculleus receptaculi]
MSGLDERSRIYPNLYIGSQEDYEVVVEAHETWCAVACLAVTHSSLDTVPPSRRITRS